MGSAINTSIEGEEPGDRPVNDLGAILDHHEALDAICDEIGVRKLSDFFDWSEMADEFLGEFGDEFGDMELDSSEEEPSFFDPSEIVGTASRLRDRLGAGDSRFEKQLAERIIEELNDLIKDATLAGERGKRMALVPLP